MLPLSVCDGESARGRQCYSPAEFPDENFSCHHGNDINHGNHAKQLHIEVSKSFTLKKLNSKEKGDTDSITDDAHGITMELTNNCSDSCNVTIEQSFFSCSSITFNNLNIWIKDSIFRSSFITAKSNLNNDSIQYNLRVDDTRFYSSTLNKDMEVAGLAKTELSEILNFISVIGYWDFIIIQRSNMEGEQQSVLSGVKVQHANVNMLNLIGVHISHIFSAMLISPSSSVSIFNITDSIFVGNRDGIDIGDGVRYMLVSNSQMNSTGSWYIDWEVYEQCFSAIKGSVERIKVEDSVFAHNRASGLNCSGAALNVRSDVKETRLMLSYNETYEQHNPLIKTIEVVKSSFYGNTLENCSVDLETGGGAIAFYGWQHLIRVVDSTFAWNEACKGAGLYISSSGWYRSMHASLSFQIIIDMCTFSENTAQYGGGMMTRFKEFTLSNGSSLSILVSNSLFSRNNVTMHGAGAFLGHSNISLYNGAIVNIQFRDTDFKENINTGKYPRGDGGGIYMKFLSVGLHFNALVKAMVDDCSFTSNRAEHGAGIFTGLKSCSVDSDSSLTLLTTACTFMSNSAGAGAGIYTRVESCLVRSDSSFTLLTTDSNITSNKALLGAGIYTWVDTCSVHSDSSLTLLTTDCNITSNEAWLGGGIYTSVTSCFVNSTSSIALQTIGSTFMSNSMAGGRGAGIYTEVFSCSVDSNSSFTFSTTESTFNANIARIGAGILTIIIGGSVHSYSSFKVRITNSIFEANKAEVDGGGVYTHVQSCSIDSSSIFMINVTDSTFALNTARRGAGVGLHTYYRSTCSSEHAIAISNCRFLNNSAFSEGGSLFFHVLPIAKIHVKHSVFENNQGLPGAGLYRENIDDKICGNATFEPKYHASITTCILDSHFINNIDTAVLVKGQQTYGTLAITKCSFKNNGCISSSFAEDIFTDMSLELNDTNIFKQRNNHYPRSVGINAQSDTRVKNLTINTTDLSHQRQISLAMFSHYITKANSSFSEYQCPSFYRPVLSTSGITDMGAVMVHISCETCYEGYFIGQTWSVISVENGSDYNCQEKDILDILDSKYRVSSNSFCHTKSIGTCIECPHGANCSAGVAALPNYWGHMTATDRLEFHRCPVGYCCNKAPCKGITQCASHRVGTLCGHCMSNFSESLLSPECLPDEECDDTWVLPLFVLWAFCVTWAIIFMGDLGQLPSRILFRFKQCCCRRRKPDNQETLTDVSDRKEDTLSFKAIVELKQITPEVTSNEMVRKNPILWGLLTTEEQENSDDSGHLKYLQIILYYIQDSSLLEVDLALGTKGTSTQNIRRMLLNISELAIDLLDLGGKLCPIKGWTPVIKTLAKRLTGPLVFLFIFIIYWIIKSACRCFPNKSQSIRKFWYPKLTAAVVFSLLLFYQQIANTVFSLLYCIKSDDHSMLFIDGTVICYQPWQILVLIFAINWVIAIIPVLMFLPGLLELRLIGMRDFFLACLFPCPMLVYRAYRIYRKKFCFHIQYRTPWQDEALGLLQKTFVKTTYKKVFPFCWIGFMKIRRLALVLIFTFVSNLVGRVSLMCFVIVVFMIIHDRTQPYQDKVANMAYTVSLLATLSIGFINIMKASCVEFYLDLDKVKYSLGTLDMITDVIFVYCPPVFITLAMTSIVLGKFRSKRNEKAKAEMKQAPVVTEENL